MKRYGEYLNRFIVIEKYSLLIAVLGSVLFIILQSLGESSIVLLRYENSLVQTGEWWRLLTGNFIHLGWTHLMMNLAALWILVLIFHEIIKPVILLACLLNSKSNCFADSIKSTCHSCLYSSEHSS